MKKALKITGFVFGGIALLVLLAAAFIQFSGIPSYPVKQVAVSIAYDSLRVERGAHMATMICSHCHQNPENGKLEGTFQSDLPKEFGKAWSVNITQDKTYGAGRYSDGELVYLLRTGIKRDGKYAPPWMPKFPHISDEDLHSIIAWLRASNSPSLQPSDKVQPASQPSFIAKLLCRTMFKPLPFPEKPIVAPPTSDKAAFGKYLATGVYDCFQCHSADFKTANVMEPEKSEGYFGGGNLLIDLEGKPVLSANLTPDPKTGHINGWTLERFGNAVRFGQEPEGGSVSTVMPKYTALSDGEVEAIFEYLKTVPPVNNDVKAKSLKAGS